MSFPATYNIRYYKGDLYQFVIRPKTSAGDIYPIDDTTYYAYFRISTSRGGLSEDTILGSTAISDNAVTCEIRPSTGLESGTTYYYDVSIEDQSNSNVVYTLLTGTINVTGDITVES